MGWEPLVQAAAAARVHAYAPYSRFAVGAAVLMEDGSIHAAGNCENCIPALAICAERSAMAHAVAAGRRRPLALAVVAGGSPPPRPCGPCRPTLAEVAVELPVLGCDPAGAREGLLLS